MNSEIDISMSVWIRYEYTHAQSVGQGSPEKQNQLDKRIYRKKEGKRWIYFKELAHVIVGAGKPEIAGQAAKSWVTFTLLDIL